MTGTRYGLRKNRSRHGFSLIELMVVIALFGILLAVGIPNLMKFRATSAGYQCARSLVSDLELARNLSLRTESETYIRFNSTDKKYDIYYHDSEINNDRICKTVYINKDFGSSVSLVTGSLTEIKFKNQGFVETSNASETIQVKSGGINYSVVIMKDGKCYVKEG